jgi:hypothetical protein
MNTLQTRSGRPTTTARPGTAINNMMPTTGSASFFANVQTLVGTFNLSIIIAASKHEESMNDGIA